MEKGEACTEVQEDAVVDKRAQQIKELFVANRGDRKKSMARTLDGQGLGRASSSSVNESSRLSKGEAKVGEKDEEEEVPKLLEFTVKENVEGMHYSNCVF